MDRIVNAARAFEFEDCVCVDDGVEITDDILRRMAFAIIGAVHVERGGDIDAVKWVMGSFGLT